MTEPQPQKSHPDMGCNTEVYADDRFLELETLSALIRLAPGQELEHEEVWKIYPASGVQPTAQPAEPATIRDYIATLSILSEAAP